MDTTNSERDPVKLIPVEVWTQILNNLRDQGSSEDMFNSYNSCAMFQKILEPTKNEWLFKMVWNGGGQLHQLLISYHLFNLVLKVCPFLLPYLDGREILACRVICKSWRHVVDTMLEDFESWKPFHEASTNISRSSRYDPLEHKGIKWTTFLSKEKILEFMQEMQNKKMKTPFVGKSVFLNDLDDSDEEESDGEDQEELNYANEQQLTRRGFWINSLELVNFFGDQMCYLRLGTTDLYANEFYSVLRKILTSTPNLKNLTLEGRYFFFHGTTSKECKQELDQLKIDLNGHELPKLKSLQTLEYNELDGFPLAICEKLIDELNPKSLKCLKMHHIPMAFERNDKITLMEPLPGLTELHVSRVNTLEYLNHVFENWISPTAPLGRLGLQFGDMDFYGMCNEISRWKNTLRMINFKGVFGNTQPGQEPSFSELDAPNIKSIEIDGIFRRGFLPSALTNSLEYLHIHQNIESGPIVNQEPSAKYSIDEEQLYNSPIWDEMEKLKVVRLKYFLGERTFEEIYTREDYKNVCMN